MPAGPAFTLEADLLTQLPLSAALEIELGTPPDLLPGRTVEAVVRENRKRYLKKLKGLLQRGLVVETPETVLARKARGGSRPVAVLTLHERVVLRALAIQIREEIAAELIQETTYEDMVDGPIEAGSQWVVHADVASFYSFVDHDVLTAEVVALSGDALAGEALADLLERIIDLCLR